MDINLGKIALTNNQIQRLSKLKTDTIKGFSYWHDTQNIIVVATKDLSDEEKSQLIAQLKVLPDAPISQKTEKEQLLEVLGLKEEDIATLKTMTAEKAAK